MKKHIYILITVVFGLLGCERSGIIESEQIDGVRFSLSVEDMDVVQTKGIVPNEQIGSLFILLFDEQGYFIGRYSTIKDGGQYLSNVPSSLSRKVMHFVSGYDFRVFEDSKNLGRTEAEVLMDLNTSRSTAFWARIVLNNGVSSTCLNGVEIKMIRNYAKFSFENQTTGDKRLGTTDYCLINRSNGGTIAPFNTATGQFEIGVITEAPNAILNASEWIDSGSLFSYDQKSRGGQDDLFLLIGAIFISPTSPSGEWCFYKVALKDAKSNRIDVVRNTHYIVKVKRVSSKGYADMNDALANEAANDVEVDIEYFDYNSVSNGKSTLIVEKVELTTASANKEVKLTYKFVADINSGRVDNSGVKIEVLNLTSGVAIDKKSLVFLNGVMSFKTGAIQPSGNQVFQAQVTVSKDNLKRVINVNLRAPFKFTNVSYSTNTDPKEANKAISVNFTIPNSPDLSFPMPIEIYTPHTPNTANGVNSNLIASTDSGVIKWIYMATKAGAHRVNFHTTGSVNTKPTLINAQNFDISSAVFSNTGSNKFNLAVERTGNKVKVWFSVPNTVNKTEVNIYTSGLTNPVIAPSSGVTQTITAMRGGVGYVFTTTRRSTWCLITFDVVEQDNSRYIMFESNNFVSEHINVPIS